MSTWTGTTPSCTIAHAKLERVITLVRASCSHLSDTDVTALVLDHRLGEDKYQLWLETADVPSIADRVIRQVGDATGRR